MTNFQLNYTHPWLLLLLFPAIALTLIPYFRVSKKYRRTRNRVISVVLHMLGLFLAINLLAGLTFSYELPNKENEVILLVDVSDSGDETREAKDEFIQTVINVCDNEYRLGIVKFGYDQKYVVPLTDDSTEAYIQYLESDDPDTSASNLSAALNYAASLFKNPKAAKIVLISDGVETDGAATSVIKAIAADGIKVDTVYYPRPEHNELQIVAVHLPEQHIMLGESFNMEITLKSNLANAEVPIKLRVYDNDKDLGEAELLLNKSEITLPISVALQERGMHELRFEIEAEGDTLIENNTYRSYVNLEAFNNILLIECYENESSKLQSLLKETYNVTALSVEEDVDLIPRDIQAMAEFEQVILVNIAYSDMPAGFEELLNEYVYSLGGGLFTVGGRNEIVGGELVPHAYNRKDLENSTYYKQMLPINAIDYTPPIAVMIVVDASASMSMGKLDAAIEGAEACLDALSDRDFCGVMSFQTRASEELEILPVSQKEKILESIRNIGKDSSASGGTIFSDAIMRAGRALSVIEHVERKHIIMVTDGNPGDTYDTYLPYIEDNVKDGITMSVVTIDIDSYLIEKMEQTAAAGEGKFYNVPYSDLHTIPAVMQKDLALEAIAEIEYGEEFIPTIRDMTPAVAGINQNAIPPLTGYYGTVLKEGALVPLMGEYVPIYANWKYGAGNVGSFMCDLNGEWSATFIEDLVGKAIISNIVKSIFPMQDVRADGMDYVLKTDNFTTQLNIHGVEDSCRIEVQVKPLSESLAALLDKGIAVEAAESNRRFTFMIKDAGLYEITIHKYDEAGALLSSVILHKTFSYSEEYNAFPEKKPLGEELMTLLAQDGRGMVVGDPIDVFGSFSKTIHKEYDPRIIFLILAIVAMLLDVAVRKFKFKWPHELIRERKQRRADASVKNG